MAIMYHHTSTSSVSVTDTLGRTQPSNFRNYFKSALDFVKCQSSCRDKKTFYSFPFDIYCVKRSLSWLVTIKPIASPHLYKCKGSVVIVLAVPAKKSRTAVLQECTQKCK